MSTPAIAALLLALVLARWLCLHRRLPPPPWRLPVAALLLQGLGDPLATLLPGAAHGLGGLLAGLASNLALLVLLSWLLLELPAALRLMRPMPQILRDLLNLAIGALVVVLGLQQAGVNLVGLVATSAVLTAVIGLAAQETLKDLFGGLSMQIGAAFRVGDWVDLGGQRGRVESITLMNTVLSTLEEARLVVPNSQAAAAVVRRYRPGSAVGHRFHVGLDYSHPPAQAMRLLLEVLERHPQVLVEPAPRVWISRYGDSAVEYELLVFQADAGDRQEYELRGALLQQIWYALNRENRRIPFPVVELRRHHHAPIEADEQALQQPQSRAELLAANPLFANLSASELATLAPLSRYLRFGPGETVVREGERGDCLYQVVSGRLEVCKQRRNGGTNSLDIAQLGPAAVFGEMTLCTDAPRHATVRTLEETLLLEVERRDLAPLLVANPALLEHLGHLVSQRQRELDALSDAAAAAQTSWLIERMRQLFNELGVR